MANLKQIDVFLMFEPTDRNSLTVKGKKTIEKGPDWEALKVEVARKGYTLIVNGPPSNPAVSEVTNSLSTAGVTVFVGHGSSVATGGSQFVSGQLKLADGMINSPDGLYQGKWSGRELTPDAGTTPAKVRINKVTALFTCNSHAALPKAFEIPEDSALITNDGGTDGLTRIGTLEQGAYAFVRRYVSSGGSTAKAMEKAQITFVSKGKEYLGDRKDKLHTVTSP